MFTLHCKERILKIDSPIVMGIINSTPDSFYEGSRQLNTDKALHKAEQMINEGATILDIGGQSTRPDSTLIEADEELRRVLPVIECIRKKFPEIFISIDTFYAKVAKNAMHAGADIVNDISGGNMDENMLATVASLQVPFVCMHMKGTPQNMQHQANYIDVTKEVLFYFEERINACRNAGIKDIILDPGFGFSKNATHNFQLLKDFAVFKTLDKPLLLGISRKSFIYKTLGITANNALNGTTALHAIGLINGASILRVHDVKEAMQTIQIIQSYLK
jgi:dihydropteroate synthase